MVILRLKSPEKAICPLGVKTGLAHGARTYLGGDDMGVNEKLNFSYSVSCTRNPVVLIGEELPSRVTKENVSINMTIGGEDMGRVVSTTGYAAVADIYVYDVYGNVDDGPIGRFGCTGRAYSQNISVANGTYMAGEISISQDYFDRETSYMIINSGVTNIAHVPAFEIGNRYEKYDVVYYSGYDYGNVSYPCSQPESGHYYYSGDAASTSTTSNRPKCGSHRVDYRIFLEALPMGLLLTMRVLIMQQSLGMVIIIF